MEGGLGQGCGSEYLKCSQDLASDWLKHLPKCTFNLASGWCKNKNCVYSVPGAQWGNKFLNMIGQSDS